MKKLKENLILLTLFVAVICSQIEDTKCLEPFMYCYDQENSDSYIYVFEEALAQGLVTENDVFNAIAYKNYLTQEGLDTFLKRGNIPSYVDDLIAVGRLPQGYTVSGSAPSTPTTPSIPQESTPTTPVIVAPTLDESKAGTYVIVDTDVKSYEDYSKEKAIRTWTLAELVEVKGLMSNGCYKVLFEGNEQYIDKSHLVPLDKYEAAWQETDKLESMCETEGYVTYTNSLTKEVKTEVLPPLEHTYSVKSEELPSCTETGTIVSVCNVCSNEKTDTVEALGHTPSLICKECDMVVLMGTGVAPSVAGVGGVILLAGIGCVGYFICKKIKK